MLESIKEFLSHVGFAVLGFAEDDEILEGLGDGAEFAVDVWFCDGEHKADEDLAVVFHESLLHLGILSMEFNDNSVKKVAEKLH